MAVYKIYHKDGSILSDANGKEIEVHSIEYNGTWMGECFVTVTFENEAPISFSIGDYIEYRSERFEINYDPGKIKCASKDSYGGAFKYDSVKFNALSDELVRCDMLDLVLYDNKLHYTALPQFTFYVESLDDLLDRIQANLDELYGKASWKLYSRNKQRSIQRGGLESEWNSIYGDGTADNVIDSTSISISDQTCWDALSLVNSQFDVNFIIRNRNVYVGTAGMPTSNIFKYGKDKGLYEIEQNSESDQAIVTRLRAYGSNRNLPNHYYADLGSVPFLNITGDYHDGSTDSGLSVMMEDSVYAGMFTDIISDNGSNTKHCRIRGSIGGYEFDGTLELVKKNVTRSTTRLLAEGKEVSDAIKAKIDAGIVEVDFIRGANKAKFDGNRINYVSNLPNNMACDRLMLPGFPNKSLKEWWDAQSAEKKAWLNPSGKEHIFSNDIYRPYVDSLNIEKIGVRPSSVFFDQDDKVNGIVEIHPTIEEMEVDGVRIDEIYTGTNVEDDGRFGDDVSDIANVAIYLSSKINFDIRGLMQDDFTIHMKDGMCAGREFKVAGCTKQNDGSWKLMIERKPDDSLNLYFPYNDFQIKKGDHFVLSGIELPDAYVEAASEKLLRYCIAYLDKNDYTRYVYQPKVDEIFMARQHDTAMADASGLTKSLYLTLKEGDIMLFKDDDLGIDAEITIDQLTIKEEDGKIPTYEITLREEKEVGTIQKIQNQISSITNGNGGSFTGGTGGGGLSSSQIKNLIDAIGSERFLSKLNPDTAAGIITFLQGTNWGNFTSETGAAMTVDPNTGQTYMEVDRLKVRLKAFFEQLEVQKVGYVGGKIVVSKGQGVDILDVEEIYDSEGNLSAYRCYFLGEQEGRRINNLLRVNDQMICKDENISEGSTDGATNKYYWRLVTAVSSDVVKRGNNVCHWVDLSATDCDTNSDIPEIGDTICHLGNREDTDRQGAEILSVVDANSPSFTIYSGINSYSLVNKEYIDMGVAGGKAFCNIYGSTYIGDRDRKSGYLRWNDDKKTFEIKGTIDITSPLSSGGTIGGAIDNAANAYKGEFDAFTSNVNEVIGGFQAQIDGVIETWFYDPEPTLGNLPASEWKDNTTKDKHLGDLYYSKSGLAYRFQKEGDIYKWVQIDDTAITSALKEAKAAKEAAAAAQGTADTAQTTAESKMKVFVQTPTNSDEYSVGDMWVNATYPADGSTYSNEILKCKEGKAAGAEFKIAHWEKASKYTDDTAAQEAQKKANEAATAAQEINASITAIDGNVDVALKDKIITKTEAASIKEALNGLDAIMADVNKTKKELVNNAVYQNIASDVKTDYNTAYTSLVAAYNELSKYITDTLLVANPITDEILSTYTTKFSTFKTKYEDYVTELTVVRNSMDALLNTRIGDIATMLGGLKATTDAMNESTQINGGLILSSLLALGYTKNTVFNVMSGVSGLYESGETGGGIAFWAGGHRIDINNCTKNTDGTYSIGGKVVNPADFLVRHDGTGYAAGGKMWWDENGKIHADPQSFLINEEYVGNVMQLFKFEYSGGTEFTNIVHAIPQKPFESLSIGANGLTLYNGDKSAKFYIKDGVLFLDGDLAVTGGITMYASNGVTSGLLDQVYAILDSSKFEIENGVITIKGEIGDGKVKGATLGGVAVTLNANGILEFDAYPTTLPASDVYAWAKAATKPTYSWGEITEKPSSFTPSAHTHDDRYYTESEINTKLDLKLDTSLKGVANGLATLDSSGKVPSSQLPSYVDDVLECINKASFPTTGESGKIYIDQTTNLTYRWGGSAYVEISQSLALGETSSTAYAGDKGKQNAADIAALKTGKADKATTLAGYGITDAYTKTEVNTKLTDGSVTKIGTKDVGSATLPIYLKAGVPTACNTTLGVSITGNSATATKLANARTLWGQSFNGSANVSGDMTGVGTITPTGEDLKVVGNLIVTGGIVMYADDGATIESGFAALLAAHIDGVTIKYNEAQQKIYSVMTGIKVNGQIYKPSETDGYITIPDYPTSLDWENIENKPSTFTPSSHTHTFASLTSKPTTLSGYGITDAKIANGVITLGTATITPLTAHQKVTLASGTNNGTLKLTVGNKTTDNIAVKGLGSAAYTASSAYAAASHTHSYLPLAGGTMTGVITLTSGSNAAYDKTALSFIKSSDKTEQARIGTDGGNGLGLYANGSIYIRPNVTLGSGSTNGLIISSSSFTYNGTAVSLAGHTHSQYLVASSLDGYVNALTDNTSTNVFVTAIAKSGKTLSYTKSFTKKSLTAASHSGWSSADTDKLIIPDMSFIAYWNGAYNSDGSSNLAYCNKGAFGDMATAAKSSYYTKSDTYSKTEVNTKLTDGSVTKVGTANVGATNVPIYLKAGVPTAVTLVDTANNLINNLTTGTSTPVDADYYIAQYVGGGTTTTTFHRRPHSALYAYIKGKAEGTWAISVSGNAATATTLQNARTLWGQSFNGSANISGNMSGVGQITFSALSGTNGRALLYQQMADNDFFRIYAGGTGNNGGYVEIATADDGTEPIYVRQYSGVFGTLVRTLTLLDGNGNTTVPGLLTAANGTVNGTLKVGAIPVTNSSSGVLKIDGNLIVTGGITMYATDGVASGLMEQILVDGTTIGKKADGTLYAINTGNVRSIIMGSTTYTPNSSGAVTLPEKVTWANIEGKPSSFTPSSHTHAISQITNLQATLDGKAASSHTHSYLPLSGGKLTGSLEINATAIGGWDEGIRIHTAPNGWCGVIMCGSDNTGSTGTSAKTWGVCTYSGQFYINRNASSNANSAYILCNVDGNWGMGTNSPSYKLHVAGDIYTTTGFKKNGSSDSYVLLGGGGHKALSDFATSGHNHDGRYLRYFRYTTSPNADSMEDGWHDAKAAITNAPTTNHGTLIQNSYNGTPFQIFIPDASYYIYKRYKSGSIGGTWTKISAGYADSADKLTSSAGSATLPIYFSDGKPVACTASSVFSNLSSSSATNLSVTVAGQNRTITNLCARYLGFTGRLSSMNVCYGDGTLRHFLADGSTTTGKPEDDSHILHFSWDNGGGWDGQLSIPITTTKHVQWRTMGGKDSNGNYIYNAWKTLANITDNVASASKWATARKITLTGSVTGSVSIDGSGNVSLATTTNHTHAYLPLAGGTMTGTIGVQSNVQNGGLKFNNSNANLNALNDQHLILGKAIRFGAYNTWDCNVWAGLKYDHANKTIYLGLADGTTFSANNAQSGGKVKFPGVSNLYISEIDEAGGGNGLIAYKPASWTGVSSSQTGFGTIITETVIRSSNSNLKHYKNGVGTYTIWDSGNHGPGSGLNADLLDGVHYLNILEREYTGSKYDSSATTKTGWYRIAECYSYSKSGFLLYLGRNYHSSNNENYIFAITVSYGGNISINQIAGSANTRLITKIRVCWSNTSSSKAYVDFYVGTEAINGYFWYTVGSAKSYGTWGANPSTSGYNTVEFSTCNGMSSNKDFYISGQIGREGKNGNWVSGRTNAMIRQTTANAYSVFASVKTYAGSWEIGEYTASGERLLFTYVTDTNFNNGNNNYSGQISFESGGNIIASGGITMYSDLRKKNILSNEVLSVKEIAAAPLFKHTYKSDDNQYIHVGTSAQYWSGIHEDWFTRKDSEGYYQMELQNLGVAMGISLAREIVTFEGAFKKYESKTDKKIRLMKKKINELEKANESLEARVKELEERRTA